MARNELHVRLMRLFGQGIFFFFFFLVFYDKSNNIIKYTSEKCVELEREKEEKVWSQSE